MFFHPSLKLFVFRERHFLLFVFGQRQALFGKRQDFCIWLKTNFLYLVEDFLYFVKENFLYLVKAPFE